MTPEPNSSSRETTYIIERQPLAIGLLATHSHVTDDNYGTKMHETERRVHVIALRPKHILLPGDTTISTYVDVREILLDLNDPRLCTRPPFPACENLHFGGSIMPD